jgi:hypothetical protein
VSVATRPIDQSLRRSLPSTGVFVIGLANALLFVDRQYAPSAVVARNAEGT